MLLEKFNKFSKYYLLILSFLIFGVFILFLFINFDNINQYYSNKINQKKIIVLDIVNAESEQDRLNQILISEIIDNDNLLNIELENNFFIRTGQVNIVLVITNLGLNKNLTDKALELKPLINLGFSSYSPNLKNYTDMARDRGFEVLLDLPMEPDNYPKDAGALSLLKSLAQEENFSRLSQILEKVSNICCLYSPLNEKFSNSSEMVSILTKLYDQRIKLLYRGRFKDKIEEMAKKIGYNDLIFIDLELDDELNEEAISRKLNNLEELAKEKKYLIVTGQAYMLTLDKISTWLNHINNENIKLIKLSEMFEDNKHEY